MLTRRGFWALFGALTAFFPAALVGQLEAVLAPLTILLWIGYLATVHFLMATVVARRITVERKIGGRTERRVVRWANRPIPVETWIRNPSWFGLVGARLGEYLPASCTMAAGRSTTSANVRSCGEVRLEFQMQFDRPGVFHLEGVWIAIEDPHGFFRSSWFVEARCELLALPGPAILPGISPSRSSDERKLGQGVHRLRAAGSSSELLEVRPYRPGDSPRSIAWKVSARKNMLMTRDYESEVPVRCTLILDASRPMRFGPEGRTPLIQATRLFATLSHRLISVRDPVGLIVVGGPGASILKAGVGARHLARIQTALAHAASLDIGPTAVPAGDLLEPVLETAAVVRPQWLRRNVNRADAWWRGLRVFSVRGMLASAVLPFLIAVMYAGNFPLMIGLLTAAVVFLVFGPKPGAAGRPKRIRKTAASVLAMAEGGGPQEVGLYFSDDNAFSAAAQRFLKRFGRPTPMRLVDFDGCRVLDSAGRTEGIARSLRSAVALARDSELILLLADLAEDFTKPKSAEPLIQALKIAAARGHLPIVLYVWPESLASVLDDRKSVHSERMAPFASPTAGDSPRKASVATNGSGPLDERQILVYGRERLLAACKKIGVPCIPVLSDQGTATIVRRIERLRQGFAHRIPAKR